MSQIYTNPKLKHDALYLFDVIDSNPNGDPDNAGKPRTDLDTGQGLASDVSLKRKIRDGIAYQVEQGILQPSDQYQIFIRRGESLNEQLTAAGKQTGVGTGNEPDKIKPRQDFMVAHYYDVRMFGAVMSTGNASAGKVTGPVSVGIARTIDPVLPIDLGITRVASTKEEDRDNASQMGNKTVIPYGLYATRVHYQPTRDNHVSEQDLEALWNTLLNMFEWSRSAARPDINVRGLFVFSHDNPLGNAPAHKLFDLIRIVRQNDVETPRSFEDYVITVPTADQVPSGVTLTQLA